MWRSWLAHHVRDVGVGRSSRLIPTRGSPKRRTSFCKDIQILGKWRSWLARCVRDAEVGCSSHLFPTKKAPSRSLFCREEVTLRFALPPIQTFPEGEGLVASLRVFVWTTVTEPFLSGRGDILSKAIGPVCDACYYCRVDAAFVDKPSFSRSMTPPS